MKALPTQQEESGIGALKSAYGALLKNEELAGYQSLLAQEGLRWWFEMDVPSLAAHLAPLLGRQDAMQHPRLVFLAEAIQPDADPTRMSHWYEIFMAENDREAACASVGAGIAAIWSSGSAYQRYSSWYSRAQALLAQDISPLAAASLSAYQALVEMTGQGPLSVAMASYERMQDFAETANSISLRLFHAAAYSYCLLWQGRFAETEMLLTNAMSMAAMEAASPVCRIYFQTTLALFKTVSGQAREAEQILDALIRLPQFVLFPPPVFFLAYGHLLYAVASSGDAERIEVIAEQLRARAVPELNYFHYSYLHFNLGVAYLLTGQPRKALLHSEEAIRRGEKSESQIAVRMPALLYGQALADLGQDAAAIEHLRAWMPRWKANGFFLLAATGAMELARLHARQGDIEQARRWHQEALHLMPADEAITLLYRPATFIDELIHTIYPVPTLGTQGHWPESALVRIETLGELRLSIGHRTLFDRDWKGRVTKNLLKALIVLGGCKVSDHALIELLWPDAPGDAAQANLKMALSRLRRLGQEGGEAPPSWVVVKQRQISLSATFCTVDALRFQEQATHALRQGEAPLLIEAITLYRDDFLARDDEFIWVTRYRERLRDLWLRCVLALADRASAEEEHAAALPYLTGAVVRAPCDEAISLRLMRALLALGMPSKAAEEFRRIAANLQAEYGLVPGSKLMELARSINIA